MLLLTGLVRLSDRIVSRVRVEESWTYILAADPVADRVPRAGCTGIEFSDPDRSRLRRRADG